MRSEGTVVGFRAEEIMLKYLNFILLLDSSIMCNLCSYFYQIMLEILNIVYHIIYNRVQL